MPAIFRGYCEPLWTAADLPGASKWAIYRVPPSIVRTGNEKGPTRVGPVTGSILLRQARSRRPRGAGGWGIRFRKDRADADSFFSQSSTAPTRRKWGGIMIELTIPWRCRCAQFRRKSWGGPAETARGAKIRHLRSTAVGAIMSG